MNSTYTKKVLADALYELLTKKQLDDIYVKDICAQCGLSKQTFYYHFKDKYELAIYLYNTIQSNSLHDYGVTDYLDSIAQGQLEMNNIGQDAITILQQAFIPWKNEHKTIARNLLRYPKDSNSPENYRRSQTLQGTKILLKKQADTQNRVLDELLLDVSASVMAYTSDYFYDRWERLYKSQTPPEDEYERLTLLLQKMLDFFVSLGEPSEND